MGIRPDQGIRHIVVKNGQHAPVMTTAASEWGIGILATIVALYLLLQVPAVEDEVKCAITKSFYLDYSPRTPNAETPIVSALSETVPVKNKCDAADDPAIWVNQADPAQSFIIGTNKARGINVYRLNGELAYHHPIGSSNNVDVRELNDPQGARRVIVGASNKGLGEIQIFELNTQSGELLNILHEPIRAKTERETYGFCLYLAPDDQLYAIATDKSGQIEQWALQWLGSELTGEFRRTLRVSTQPEGCVADDINQTLFVGEEDVGIWKFDARPDGAKEGTLIASTENEALEADVEGLAIYANSDGSGFLVASSQGNDSYALFDRTPPHAHIANFQIEFNGFRTGDTDGLAVTSLSLGSNFPDGLLVVQDGAPTWLERHNQNFKLVSWRDVQNSILLTPANSP